MTDDPAMTRGGRALAGAAVGVSIWISAGTLAVVNGATLARLGALPGWGTLAAAVVSAIVVAVLAPLRRSAVGALALLVLLWLPWLPLHVPAVFLLWEGPLEIGVWAVVLVALLRRAVPPGLVARLAHWWAPPWAPLTAGLLAAAVFAAAWIAVRPRVPAGDEPHYLVITQSLLRDGDLLIENNHRDEHYLEYYDSGLKPDFMQRGIDRQIYSIHAPGVSVLVLPAFAVAGYAGAVAAVVVAAGAGLAGAWVAAFWLTGAVGAAWAAWLALLVSAPIALHGFMVYPDGVGAAAAMAGVLGLVALDRFSGPALGRGAWLAIGAALALLPWLHTRFALIAGLLGLALSSRLLGRAGGRQAWAAFAVAPALAAAAWFTYFWRIYGTLNPAAPYGARPEGALAFVPAGVVGLLIDQQFGVAANAPVLVAGLIGLVPLARRRPRLAIELSVIMALYLCTVAVYPMWWGGYSAPGRFAVVVLPMLAVPLAAWWADGPVGRRVVGVLTVVSAAITLTVIGHDRGAFLYNGRDGHALLLDWLSPTVDLTLGAPSVHRDGAAVAVGDAVVWLLAGVAVVGAGALLARRRWSRAWTSGGGVLAAPVAAMIALPVVWAGRDRPAVTPPTSQLAFLDRWNLGARPIGVELTPTRWLDPIGLARRLSLGTNLRGHRAPGVSALLQIPQVPAGEFDVIAEGRSRLEGTATVQLGRDPLTMDTWVFDGRPAGPTAIVLRLPAIAPSITVVGDDAARASIRRLLLRPRTLPAAGSAPPVALRAARFGSTVLFALDDNAYLEPGAVWIRGERRARIVLQADDEASPPVLRLTAGPVSNTVSLTAAGWSSEVALSPGQVRDVSLPVTALAPAELTIASASGFRPSEHDAGNGDVRWLGVYLTWP